MNTDLELSVVVLCYGAEESIVPFAQKLKNEVFKLTDSFEIVLVGNYQEGAADKTPEIIKRMAEEDPTFRALSKVKEGMMGWDVRQGLAAARGKFLCFVDGDGQFPIESITGCYKIISKGEFGLVKTYRTKREDGLQRIVISHVYNAVFKLLFPHVKSKDVNSKPKIFLRSVYETLDLSFDDWFIDAEIMIKASRLGVKFYEFPISFRKLENRTSYINYRVILEFVQNLVAYKLKDK